MILPHKSFAIPLFVLFIINNCKKNSKTYFVSQDLNEVKCKITSKTTRKLKSESLS